MSKLKLIDKNSILQFIENSIESKDTFMLWDNQTNSKSNILSLKLKKLRPNNTIEIKFLNCDSGQLTEALRAKILMIKHCETGLFFRTSLKKANDNSYFIQIPKILNFNNTREKSRNVIPNDQRVKFTGIKSTSYDENFKFTGNIIDYHFNGMAVHINNQYIGQISLGDILKITKIDEGVLKTPVEAEVRFISKEKREINSMKKVVFKVGLFIREKLPAEIIFSLNKYIQKKAS